MVPSSQAIAVGARGLVLTRDDRVALRVDELAIPAGAVTALVGPNGSGKSTLLHAIAGLLLPSTGDLEVVGTVAYVLQTVAVTEHLPISVREVVTMGRYGSTGLWRRLTAVDRQLVDDALERLELADLAGRQLGSLSGGQRQRALVAQALAQDAEVLLLDEPVTGLDLASAERIRQIVEAERARGRTVVVATHDLGEAAQADHVVLLAGRVVAAGSPADVLTRESLAEAYGGRLLTFAGDTLLLDDGSHHEHGH